MADFNFDIDQIADNAVIKTDKTTDIISDLPTDTNGQISFFEKLSADQQTAITAKAPALVDTFWQTKMRYLILVSLLLKGSMQRLIISWQSKKITDSTSG